MNKYEILQTIGEGEYGVVLKARNKQTQQLVAIKKFKQDDSDLENKKIILRQIKVLKMMHHQNITQLKEAFRKKGKVFIVCQYVQKNLLQIIQQNRAIDSEKIKLYLTQLLKGLEYMHTLDLIHRDLKPQNLLINSDHTLKICDFGFARPVPTSGKMTDYVATRWYRSPQLLLGRDDYNKSVDIWATGCILSQMIDGNPLFPGQSQIDQLYLMQRCLGPLAPDHQQYFLKNPKFGGMKFPEFNHMQSLDRRYIGKIDKQGLDLLKKMLKMNPVQRISVSDALKHPYLSKPRSFDKKLGNEKINAQSVLKLPNNNQQYQKINREQKIGRNKVTGVNKLKILNNQQTKSKIIQNLQNKVTLNANTNITQAKQGKQRLIKKQQFQYILQKKAKSPQTQQQKKPYPPDFQQQQRIQTPILKSRQNYRKRKKLGFGEQQEQSNYNNMNNNIFLQQQQSKTPTITKMLVKKKVSRISNEQQMERRKRFIREEISKGQKESIKMDRLNNDGLQQFEYIGINNFKKKDEYEVGNYNIILNQNTYNYNYGKR